MKRIILSFFLIAATISTFGQSVQEQARKAYDDGNYKLAIELYETEVNTQKALGVESSDLYYNLGNAYFRYNQTAKARLYFERAQLLDPGDGDIGHNIEYLKTLTEDKIPVADTFFLKNWFHGLQNLFSSDGWAWIGVLFFVSFILCLFLFFFSKSLFIKKAAFYTGIVFIIIVVLANIFAYNQKDKIENRSTAIIMAASATVLSSPDVNGTEIITLHAGTKVRVSKEDRSWIEIEMDNGDIGWVQRDKIEII